MASAHWKTIQLLLFAVYSTADKVLQVSRPPIFDISTHEWAALNASVGGNLHNDGHPFATPCYNSGSPNSTECLTVRQRYGQHVYRADQFGSYMNPAWEGCQSESQSCALDYKNPSGSASLDRCHQGSVSSWYIDVLNPEHVTAAFRFATRTNVPLVIKNTGHDYRGRSSAPNSLALWTRHLQQMSFDPTYQPQGCVDMVGVPAVTVGAGVVFDSVYKFADQHNVTIVGGTDESVGISGGWVQGGGHSILSPTLGLGVDRVLQFKVVTPDGVYRVANACQHRDLFYALRGGGGGTFGVVMESTHAAAPKFAIQVAHFTYPRTNEVTREAWRIMIDNIMGWTEQGFSSYIFAGSATFVTPLLNHSATVDTMSVLTNFTKSANISGTSLIVQVPSFHSLYSNFIKPAQALVGVPLALSSRLVPRANFETAEGREEFLEALVEASSKTNYSPRLQGVAPTLYKHDARTSVHPGWRDAVWHVMFPQPWKWDASLAEIKDAYKRSSDAINIIKAITPSSGAYQNEADVHTADPAADFWGPHYPALLRIKRKYDPHHILDCWQCVGWKGPANENYACYV